MKSFHQFLTEAENSIPLDLSEAVEWFSIFDEELSEVDKLEVLEELSEEDLINLAWLKEYLIEQGANKIVPFGRSKVQQDIDKLLNQIRTEKGTTASTKVVPFGKSKVQKGTSTKNPKQYSQPAGPQRPTSDLKVSKSGLDAAKDVARSRQSPSSTLSKTGAAQASAPASSSKLRQSVSNLKSKVSPKLPSAPKLPSGLKGAAGAAGRLAGPALTAVDAALTYKGRRSEGESRKRAAAGTATQVGTGLAAATAGAKAGAAVGSVLGPKGALVGGLVGGGVGYVAGSEVGKKVFNVAAGTSPAQKKAMDVTRRKSQSGTGIVGTGGPAKVDTKKNTITTGGKTVALPKMQVNPQTGKAGYLAYKGGQATYKSGPDPSTLAKTSSNPLERIGRTLNPGAYAKQDTAAKASQLKQAQAGTASYKKSLGIK